MKAALAIFGWIFVLGYLARCVQGTAIGIEIKYLFPYYGNVAGMVLIGWPTLTGKRKRLA